MPPRSHDSRTDPYDAPISDARELPGFFRYHGIWAPGVRLFRQLAFTA